MNGVALIPARGGSKRVPRKNIRPFLGEPAIGRVIRTIRLAGVANRILVSTDDDEVADLATSAGAEVPGRRPHYLADDHATTIEVVRHAARTWLADLDPETPLWVVYPTALLLRPDDLRSADHLTREDPSRFVVPVLRFPHPVERSLRMSADGALRPHAPEFLSARTQDLEPAFHDAGQFYVGSISRWLLSSPLTYGSSIGFELPRGRVVDIDGPDDWRLAETLARAVTASPIE